MMKIFTMTALSLGVLLVMSSAGVEAHEASRTYGHSHPVVADNEMPPGVHMHLIGASTGLTHVVSGPRNTFIRD